MRIEVLVLAMATLACENDKADDDAASGENGTVGDVCSDYSEIAGEPTPVEVELVNARAEPIFVFSFSYCLPHYFGLERDGMSLVAMLDACQFTCDERMAQDPVMCFCEGSCASPPVIRIEPGGRYTTTWAGKTFSAEEVPGSCLIMDACDGPLPCFIGEPASAGSYTARTQAGTAVTCLAGNCECMPGETSCMVSALWDGSDLLGATGTFEHPNTGVVEVIFE